LHQVVKVLVKHDILVDMAQQTTWRSAALAESVERARASLQFEGVDFDGAALAVVERFAAGELTDDKMVREMARLPL
jgi:Antitoxin VbhA